MVSRSSGGDLDAQLAAGLTRALADNDHLYLYGNGRMAQYNPASAISTEYFMGDALGSAP